LPDLVNSVKQRSVTRRTGQHHGDLRRALLDAALAWVSEGDAAADAIRDLTLREVARRAGVSPAAPYHHFADKSALLAAVAEEGFVGLLRRQADVMCDEPGRALARMTRAYVEFALEHPAHYALMFAAPPHLAAGPEGEALQTTARQAFLGLVGAIRRVRPDLGDEPAARLALHAWAHAHGAVQVSAWAAGLDPDFQASSFASDVGEAVLRLTLAEPAV
jgi:AcrR family transcriptional regulator